MSLNCGREVLSPPYWRLGCHTLKPGGGNTYIKRKHVHEHVQVFRHG